MFKTILSIFASLVITTSAIASPTTPEPLDFYKSIAGEDAVYLVNDELGNGYVLEAIEENGNVRTFECYSLAYIPSRNQVVATEFYGDDIAFLSWERGTVRIWVPDGELIATNNASWEIISSSNEPALPYNLNEIR